MVPYLQCAWLDLLHFVKHDDCIARACLQMVNDTVPDRLVDLQAKTKEEKVQMDV